MQMLGHSIGLEIWSLKYGSTHQLNPLKHISLNEITLFYEKKNLYR